MASDGRHFCVIVISCGRPECLLDITRALQMQTRRPDRILLVVTDKSDLPQDLSQEALYVQPEVFITTKGTCHQRNVGLDALAHTTGIVAFLDDDYLPSENAFEAIEAAFDQFGSDVAGMSGHLIADGATGAGLSKHEADKLLQAHKPATDQTASFKVIRDTIGLYGCNMVLRIEDVADVRFDENLPLYAWQEDVDFGHRVARSSGKRMILTDAFTGVHRGVKNGRESRGRLLGYSQLTNAWYLWRHNGLPSSFAFTVAAKNFLANHAKLLRSEPWIDRRGRAYGNWLALIDILLCRADPNRIHKL